MVPRTKARNAHRLGRTHQPSLKNWGERPVDPASLRMEDEAVVECGWGRLIFAHTFRDGARLADVLREERPGQRDIAFYLRDPHVVLSLAPQELFLDPSHTFRLWLNTYRPARATAKGFTVRKLRTREEADAVNRIYAARRMVPTDPQTAVNARSSRVLTILVAIDDASGEVVGSVTGVDHALAFGDPENGSSLWCLAVDPQVAPPGVGEHLVRRLTEQFLARGRSFMDLSVLHDNEQAIALYEKLGFQRVPVFALKRKNPINERLFIGPPPEGDLNPYARIIVDEARRRGIAVDVLDAEAGYFALGFGGRTIVCRESLSELTTAIAMSRCDDKAVTRRLLKNAGLNVPDQAEAGAPANDAAFLEKHGRIVVKPARGEQGAGISVDLSTPEAVETAVATACKVSDRVLLEQYVAGQDLRIVVIGYQVVAAAVRRPPRVVGDGVTTIRSLVEKQSRRRTAATGGESRIPLDDEAVRCIALQGWRLNDVPPAGTEVTVRKTANLHTGGTIHDVTAELHADLADAAVRAARALDIPVVGLDFLVTAPNEPDYVIIEANERPGLANHEPQPTAEKFIDLLFPQTAPPPGAREGQNP